MKHDSIFPITVDNFVIISYFSIFVNHKSFGFWYFIEFLIIFSKKKKRKYSYLAIFRKAYNIVYNKSNYAADYFVYKIISVKHELKD